MCRYANYLNSQFNAELEGRQEAQIYWHHSDSSKFKNCIDKESSGKPRWREHGYSW